MVIFKSIHDCLSCVLQDLTTVQSIKYNINDIVDYQISSEDIKSNTQLPEHNISTVEGYAGYMIDIKNSNKDYPSIIQITDNNFISPGECKLIKRGSIVQDEIDIVIPTNLLLNINENTIEINKELISTTNIVTKGSIVDTNEIIIKKKKPSTLKKLRCLNLLI